MSTVERRQGTYFQAGLRKWCLIDAQSARTWPDIKMSMWLPFPNCVVQLAGALRLMASFMGWMPSYIGVPSYSTKKSLSPSTCDVSSRHRWQCCRWWSISPLQRLVPRGFLMTMMLGQVGSRRESNGQNLPHLNSGSIVANAILWTSPARLKKQVWPFI